MSITKHTLPNGVRVLVEEIDQLGSVATGLWCTTGSIHEQDDEAGLTHFIEHMLFKGTQRRTAREIAMEIEGRGGMLNAFTDKERTCYYARSLAEDLPVAVDVLTDMLTHSLLDSEEIEREKGVILEEIKRSEDEPEDVVHERHIQGSWPTSVYGKPIIGTSDSVKSFQREHFVRYMERRYNANNVLLVVAGRCKAEDVIRHAETTLGHLAPGESTPVKDAPTFEPGKLDIPRDVQQVHFCIGGPGLSNRDENAPTLWVLDAILGGGMSSRLFQEVRERRGLAYSVGSYSLSYLAGGAYTIYGGTGLETWAETERVIHTEIDRMSTDLVPAEELDRVKRQLSGQMILALENTGNRMQRLARNELVFGRTVSLDELRERIHAVTAEQVRALAQIVLPKNGLRTTTVVPQS